MKKGFVMLIALCVMWTVQGQNKSHFFFSTAVGSGFSMSEPASVPVVWHVTGYYNLSKRFSAGVGTGLSFYEKPLIPLFVDVRLLLSVCGDLRPLPRAAQDVRSLPKKRLPEVFFGDPLLVFSMLCTKGLASFSQPGMKSSG